MNRSAGVGDDLLDENPVSGGRMLDTADPLAVMTVEAIHSGDIAALQRWRTFDIGITYGR